MKYKYASHYRLTFVLSQQKTVSKLMYVINNSPLSSGDVTIVG